MAPLILCIIGFSKVWSHETRKPPEFSRRFLWNLEVSRKYFMQPSAWKLLRENLSSICVEPGKVLQNLFQLLPLSSTSGYRKRQNGNGIWQHVSGLESSPTCWHKSKSIPTVYCWYWFKRNRCIWTGLFIIIIILKITVPEYFSDKREAVLSCELAIFDYQQWALIGIPSERVGPTKHRKLFGNGATVNLGLPKIR